MKKVLKGIGIVIAVLLGIVGIFIIYISAGDIPSYEIEKIEFTTSSSPEAIERGRKLATLLCANCHMNSQTRQLTGKQMLDAPPEFGVIYSQNITQDKTYGIGNWTDAEIVYLLRTGIKKNGQYSPPYMAKIPNMADEDINAIVAFLRSDDDMVNAAAVEDKPCEPSFLTKLLCKVAFGPFPMPEKEINMPDTNNSIELGEYLAYNLECFSCHSADFKTNNYLDPTLSEGYFGGGNKPLNEKGQVKNTPNLTPDIETGIGSWTKEEFSNAVRYGRIKNDKPLAYPMMPYTQLTDQEVGAIYDYLRTIPAISNKVERSIYN